MIGCLVKWHLNRNPKGGVAWHVMSGLGNSHCKDPEARARSTYSGNIPEADVAREGSEMAIWGDEVQNGTTHCPNSLSWTCPIYTCGPSIVINGYHPHSLRCLGLNDKSIWSFIQGGTKEWGESEGPCWPSRWEPWEDVEQRRG